MLQVFLYFVSLIISSFFFSYGPISFIYIKIIVYVFLHSQTRGRCVHVNPHVHVVYADFCLYKVNP